MRNICNPTELDRRAARVHAVLAAMRTGQSLQLQFNGRALWTLSGGRAVSPEIASLVIASAHVRPAGGALFPDAPAQQWEIAE
ncbi:hypothetical protein [Bradyrhizobium sp. McL0616]|uniref:hypothetical protein n=1 Tax=Bradyrhizobium sp. McL0616 TaxID=3415674 RepID=UPI003CF64078